MVKATNLNLDDDDFNKKFTKKILKNQKELVEDRGVAQLIRTGSDDGGNFALYIPSEEMIDYYIKYKTMNKKILGSQSVTQLAIWRRLASPYVGDITKHVFNNILLPKFGTIMSDAQQTENGRDFWIRRMAEASNGPYDIGLVDFNNNKIVWWDRKISIRNWINSLSAWGLEDKYQALRFLIRLKA